MSDDLGFSLPEEAKLSRTRAVAIGVIGVLVLGGAFLFGWLPRRHAQKELAAETKSGENTRLRVEVITPKLASSDRALLLPGNVQPLEETTLYARATGYVRKWNADIGDKVKEGDVLAEIDTPELDSQIEEAKAQLARAEAGVVQAKANLTFSKQTLERAQNMAQQGVASTQELDQRRTEAQVGEANVTVAAAAVDAQRSNLHRLQQTKAFAHVVAPFSGTVTQRTVERGALVTAGNGANPLYKVSATDPVRVFVQVPQDVAPTVRVDLPAQVTVREFAGRSFDGKVARAAGALDPTTRTMTTEVRVPNPKNELLGGMYAQVALTLPTPHRVYELPATAVLNDMNGIRVAIVTPDNTLHLVKVVVERDTGPTVQIATGLDGTEKIVKLGSAELIEGRQVDVAPAPSPSPAVSK
jgi:membrane fusion protein, multidrug efflux system